MSVAAAIVLILLAVAIVMGVVLMSPTRARPADLTPTPAGRPR